MRGVEALSTWQQALLGQPVEQEQLKEAYAHIGACQERCARILGTAPDVDPLTPPAEQPGRTDLYERLGLSAEEEGGTRARAWARVRRQGAQGTNTKRSGC